MNRWLLALCALGLSACDGNLIASANLMVATIPCALLFFTINLSKE